MKKSGTDLLVAPFPGLVIRYAYLWKSEQAAGREEGVKDRPCAVVLALRPSEAGINVAVAPITHAPPDDPDLAIEIPPRTKARLGLDWERSWVVLSEINVFEWPGPDLRAVPGSNPPRFDYGVMPPSFFRQVRNRLAELVRNRRSKVVARSRP